MSPPSAVRQHGQKLTDIRHDHRARYEFAAQRLKGRVLDAACGIGYGSNILAKSGLDVTACDISGEAIAEGLQFFDHEKIEWNVGDIRRPQPRSFDGVVCFEALEHLPDPAKALEAFRLMLGVGCRLIASVPNENVIPFNADHYASDEYPHLRHYTPDEFAELLGRYRNIERFTQDGKYSDVCPGDNGRTLVYVCER